MDIFNVMYLTNYAKNNKILFNGKRSVISEARLDFFNTVK